MAIVDVENMYKEIGIDLKKFNEDSAIDKELLEFNNLLEEYAYASERIGRCTERYYLEKELKNQKETKNKLIVLFKKVRSNNR